MKKILESIVQGQCVLVTVAEAKGSTPRKVGAMMVVGNEGILAGTVGGGLLENECRKKAIVLLQDMKGCLETYVLDNTKAEALGMVCGGNTKILFTPIVADMKLKVERALELVQEKKAGSICLSLDGKQLDIIENYLENKKEETRLVLPLVSESRIFLVGGGHVAAEVGKLLNYLNFRYIVVEDREAFAREERFPHAEAIIQSSYEELIDNPEIQKLCPITKADGFCVVTRGHAGDTNALRFALSTEASYIGVMGSRRKREAMLATLDKEGYAEARARVTSPIGLDIGAQTPEELAVSIVGQLISWRARKE
ncbi:MAG: XdhC family protein [Eubacteriales bacterium]